MTIVKELFSKLKRKKAVEQESAEKPYREILEKLSIGDEPDLETLEIVVEKLNKSPTEIEKDVDLLKRRKERGALLALKPQAEADLAKHSGELEKITREMDGVIAGYRAKQGIHQAAIRAAEFTLIQANSAEEWLKSNPLDRSQIPIIEDLRSKMMESAERRNWLEQMIRELEPKIRSNKRILAETLDEAKIGMFESERDHNYAQGKREQAERLERIIENQEASVASYKEELREIIAQNAECHRKIEQIQNSFLTP